MSCILNDYCSELQKTLQIAEVCLCLQVSLFRTYDTMAATARRHPEGSLVYVIDQTDLYLRVREGVRQVYVKKHQLFILKFAASQVFFKQIFTFSFQLGNYIALPGDVSGSFLTSPLSKTQM